VHSREVLKLLKDDGWRVVRIKGDHHQLQHATKPGTVTVQHPKKELAKFVLHNIEKVSGVKLLR
jgi:predicted RNA binding protein YcfA (HicA-like mRNA interferase family)